jgi:DNA-binding PadR family transcriptional regulator
MPIEGTLYPLRRMEEQGLLKSSGKSDGPPRRYYALSAEGVKVFKRLSTNWRGLVGTVEKLMTESGT